jgi:hypothetical protein
MKNVVFFAIMQAFASLMITGCVSPNAPTALSIVSTAPSKFWQV